jgi:EAL domain-containing protein (putative c-di-GMP-specific phosphodiesterase class I)
MTRDSIDSVKIGPALVRSVGAGPRGASIVAAIIGFSHALGASTVGEGVEDSERANDLAGLGCDMIQGYIVCRPLTVENLSRYLREHIPAAAEDIHPQGVVAA